MSETVAEYLVRVKGDSSSAEKAADTTERRFDGLQKKMGGWGKSLTGQAALSAVGFVGLTGPILGVGYKMVQSASDQEEALNKVNVVYGGSSKVIRDWADTSAVSMGMTRTEALDTAGTFGNIYTSMGFTQEEAGNMSMQFIGLATDLGSFNNVPTPEALSAIQSGLVGEYEPLKRFGILINEDKVKMKALEMGLGDANGNLTEQEKILARQQLIWEQSSNAHGDFAETSDSLSNSTKILKAQIGNLAAELGAVLLPVVSKVINGIVGFLGGLGKLSPTLKTVVVVVGAFLAALGPVLMIVSALMPAIGLVGSLFASLGAAVASAGGVLAVLTGPIGLVVAALVGLGVAYKTNFLGFGDAVRSVGSKIKSVFNGIVKEVTRFTNGFKRAFSTLKGNPLEKFLGAIAMGLRAIGGDNTPRFLVELADGFDTVANFVGDALAIFKMFRTAGADPVAAAIRTLGQLFPALRGYVEPVIDAIRKLMAGFVNVKDAVDAFLHGDFTEGFAALKAGFLSIFDGITDLGGIIRDMLADVDWAGVWDTVKKAALTAWDAIVDDARETISSVVDAISSVNWSGFLSGAWNAIQTGLTFAWNAITSINWRDFIPNVDWAALIGKIEDFGTWLAGVVKSIPWSTIISGTIDIVTWLADKVGKIPWSTIISGTVDIVTWLANKVGKIPWSTIITGTIDIVTWLADKVGKIPWTKIVTGTIDIVTWLADKVGKIPWSTIITGTIEFGTWLSGFLNNIAWPTVETISTYVSDWVGDLPTIDWPSIEDIKSMIQGWIDKIPIPDVDWTPWSSGIDQNAVASGGMDTDMGFMGPGRTGGSSQTQTIKLVLDTSSADASLVTFQSALTGALASTLVQISVWGVQVVSRVSTAYSTVNNQTTAWASTNTGILSSWAARSVTVLTVAMSQLQTQVMTGTAQMSSTFRTWASTVSGILSTWRGTLLSTVSGAMSAAVNAVRSQSSNMASALRTGANDGLSAIRNVLGRIPSVVSSIGGDAAATAYNIGANISSSFAAGMRSALGDIENSAARMVQAADIALRKKAQIASPSKVFRGHGRNGGHSFGLGFLDMIPDVQRSVGALVSATSSAFTPLDFNNSVGFGSQNQLALSGNAIAPVPAGVTLIQVSLTKSEFVEMLETLEGLPAEVLGLLRQAISISEGS